MGPETEFGEQRITVVGIGADGWKGLTPQAKATVTAAQVLLGGRRHLDLVPDGGAEKVPWPSPLLPGLDDLIATHAGRRVCVLASGDPLLSGIGNTLTRRYGTERLRILPGVSSVALARARLGWTSEETEAVSVVGRDLNRLNRVLAPGRRLLVLSSDENTPAQLAALLTERGYGGSRMTVLEELDGPAEQQVSGRARVWRHTPGSPLNLVAVTCAADPETPLLPSVPGLPDDAFEHDGQLTKRDIRASTLARLAPVPGQLLWDVGAGCGSIAIEWCRVHTTCRAVAVERDPERAARIGRNAAQLGVPDLHVVTGAAPEALGELDTPDAVFVGGGVTSPGLLEACWERLADGGRLVANAVTVEAEKWLAGAYGALGGDMVRLGVEHAAPLGGFTGWTPARTVTQWSIRKPRTSDDPLQARRR